MNRFTGKNVGDFILNWQTTSLSDLTKAALKYIIGFGILFTVGYFFSIPSKENWLSNVWHFLTGIDFACATFCLAAIPFRMRADLRT